MDILLADGDEPYLRKLQDMILRDCGSDGSVRIETATEIDQAVAKLTGNGFDACFLGISLDRGTGVDVLRAIESLDLRTAFIFMAAQADKAVAYSALNLGAIDFLVKSQLDSFGLAKSLAFSLFRKSREMELRGAALHDSLTGLGNRTLFREQAGKLLQQARRARHHAAVVFMDVDGLKPVNDTYGHQVGDQVLKQIAVRLLERVRESDIVARLGGDEFLVLLGRVDGPHVVARVADGLSKAISQEAFSVNNHIIRLGLSCGTALFPEDSENIDDLIRLADQRMYEIKARHKKGRPSAQLNW